MNSYTTGRQYYSSVATAPNGEFVVVWQAEYLSGTQARLFSSQGLPLGPDFPIHDPVTHYFYGAAVDFGQDGTFVVVWSTPSSEGTDTSGTSIQGRLFSSGGVPLGAQFQVNSYTTDYQSWPAVKSTPQGQFVVVWGNLDDYGGRDPGSIRAQILAADGTPLGDDFQVNTVEFDWLAEPDIAVGPGGEFVITWWGRNDIVDPPVASARRFTADAQPAGPEFQLDSDTSFGTSKPQASFGPGGDFVITWVGREIYGRRFDDEGSPLGEQFRVNSLTSSSQFSPRIAHSSGGEFIIVWTSSSSVGNDNSQLSIQGQRFAGDATPRGAQFQVNTYTSLSQRDSEVAFFENQDDFLVVWESVLQDGSDLGIYGQRFSLPAELFADGFESGNTSSWSAVQGLP